MVEEKGLDGAVADKIGEYVSLKGESSRLPPFFLRFSLPTEEDIVSRLRPSLLIILIFPPA